jgi:tetratricopeptide (TPR) repeat protein
MDESSDKRQIIEKRKKLSELLVEAGIVKPEELPRGLEYNQKASDADLVAVSKAKELISEQGLSIPTALRALTLSKQKRVDFEQALAEIGWRARSVNMDEQRTLKSAFSSAELEGIEIRHAVPGLKAGLKASGLNLRAGASKPLSVDTADPNSTDPRFQSSSRLPTVPPPNAVPGEQSDASPMSQGYSYSELFGAQSKYDGRTPGNVAPEADGQDDTLTGAATLPVSGAPGSPSSVQAGTTQPPALPQVTPVPPLPDWSQPSPAPGSSQPASALEWSQLSPMPSSLQTSTTPEWSQLPPMPGSDAQLEEPASGGTAAMSTSGPPPIPGRWSNPSPTASPQAGNNVSAASPRVMTPPPLPGAPPPIPTNKSTLSDTVNELPPNFLAAVQMGDSLFSQQAYEQAEIFYAQAVELLEKSTNDQPKIAELLVKLGRAGLHLSQFTRAERYLTRSLKIREELFGRDDITVAECLDYLAELFDVQSQYLEAEQYYLSALGIKERVLSPGASEVANSLKKLVAVSKHRGSQQGEEKLSGELLTEAGLLDMSKLQEGLTLAQRNEVPVGRALISLNYLTESDLESVLLAQLLLREGVIPGYLAVRALRLASEQQLEFEQALKEIGLEPTDSATSGAFELLQMAKQLIRAEKQLAYDHPDIAPMCIKLGDLYVGHGQFGQAEVLFRRALGIEEKQEPQNAMKLIEVLSRLSDLEVRRQGYDQAEQIYVRLLDLWETQDTENVAYSNTLESLATLNYVRGDYKEAGRLYQLAINHKERLLGPEHPGIVSSVQGRANCYFATQRFTDAEKLYRRAAKIHEKVHGNNNEVAVSLACTLGDMFFGQNDFPRALEEYAQALDCLGNCADPDVSVFLSVLEKAAHCLYQSGELEKADTYYRHYINTREASGTANTLEMADALDRYALVLEGLKRKKEADNARKWCEEIRAACAASL